MNKLTLITGGTRSGKSRKAHEMALGHTRRIYLATAEAVDSEMIRRIQRHQEERACEFVTLEEPLYLAEALQKHADKADVILVDCLTFWLNNLFYRFGEGSYQATKQIEDFLRVLDEKPVSLILVTNEINMGVISADPMTRRFMDEHGLLNQEAARRADEVLLMVAGMSLSLRIRQGVSVDKVPRLSWFDRLTTLSKVEGLGMVSEVEPIISKKRLLRRSCVPPRNDLNAFKSWQERALGIPLLDSAWRQRARKRLTEQTRPEKSLGELEQYLERIVAIQEKERPVVTKKRIVIFAADHGVEAEGVSLYPREVTPAMVYNFLSGGATINAFARSLGAEVEVVDVGVDHSFLDTSGLISKKIRRGTSNFTKTQAMSHEELLQALEIGYERARDAQRSGIDLLGVGEMGIGNTTAASAVIAALIQADPEQVTGRGTGIDEKMLQHKIQTIKKALETHQETLGDPFSILQSVGGFEIAAITGFILGAAMLRIPCVVDGWIASAGALAAVRMNPLILDYLFFAHESEERGHRILLEELDVHPVLRLSMRLGEGTGACLAMGILDAAVNAYNEVATFEEAKVAGKKSK